MDESPVLEEMRQLISAPDPLVVVRRAAGEAGDWRVWTLDWQIWFLRKRSGLTQADLARRSGVSQHRISRIEAGEDVKWSTLRSLWVQFGYEPLVIPDSLGLPKQPRTSRQKWGRSLKNMRRASQRR